jgi:CDP-diacylglycerol--serine O-phosphatidyltransferase
MLHLPRRWLRRPEPPLRRRRAAYVLPTLFTAGNIFLGFLSIVKSLQGSLLASSAIGPNPHLETAAKAIGVAVVMDGLDGRIARLTHTVSEFGRELDSLADVITFGIAPAILAFVWGVQFATGGAPIPSEHLIAGGLFRYLPVPAVRGCAPGAVQYSGEPRAQEPGSPGSQVFRRSSDSRRCGADCRRGLCYGCHPSGSVAVGRGLDAIARLAQLPHGQHVAVS